LNVLIAYTTGRCFGKYDERKGKGKGAKCREDATLDAMPHDREPCDLLRYDDRVPCPFLRKYYRKMLRRHSLPALERSGEQFSGKSFSARKHGSYAASFVRPTRRRACTIFRPEAVFARARNPWVVARFFFFG